MRLSIPGRSQCGQTPTSLDFPRFGSAGHESIQIEGREANMELIHEIGFRILLCIISLGLLVGALQKAQESGELEEIVEIVDEGLSCINRFLSEQDWPLNASVRR